MDTGTKDVTADTAEDTTEEDSGGPSDGGKGDGGGCSGAAKKDCTKCCNKAHPKGHKTKETAQLTCACTPELCGPLEGGKGIDSGALDEGACKLSCGTTSPPDSHCDTCLDKATGTKKKPGDCYSAVSTACMADPDCVAYDKCLVSCGG